jgi:hypothetical protein
MSTVESEISSDLVLESRQAEVLDLIKLEHQPEINVGDCILAVGMK